MLNRPRCRDWSALATQQLRLRNLVSIEGQNIICGINSQLYFTLHFTAMSAPFYTSEKIDSHGTGNVVWPEINCPQILKSPARCVCIRVWEHHNPLSLQQQQQQQQHQHQQKHRKLKEDNSIETVSKIDDNLSIDKSQSQQSQQSLSSCSSSSNITTTSNNNSSSNNDKMLFIWGVYFSGLMLLMKRSEAKFHPNSLIFQMHGGHFASTESLVQDSMRQQLRLMYQLDQETINTMVHHHYNHHHHQAISGNCSISNVSDATTTTTTTITKNYKQNLMSRTAKSCDIFSNTSSNSFINANSNSKFIIENNDNDKYRDEFRINSPRSSRSCSPIRNKDLNSSTYYSSLSSSNLDLNRSLLEMLKIRYIDKQFLNSEVRSSYSLDKLLKLQERQRKYKRRSEEAKEIIEKICMKSAFCLNLELISSHKGYLYRQRNNPSMGRTLNRLLYQQEPQIKPEDILKGQELKRQIETAKLRCRLLQQQYNRSKMNLRQLEKKLNDLHDCNIEKESFVMENYRKLSKQKDQLIFDKNIVNEKHEIFIQIQNNLIKRQKQLCRELKEIYPIERKTEDRYTIMNVAFPNTDKLSNDKLLNAETISPLSLSVALGYITHVIQMCSIILNLPLRNPVKHEGSRSRIFDIKSIPNNISREFPLYSRSNPPSKQFIYAVLLLNQNIAQLNFQVHSIKCDLKSTLQNILQLIEGNKIILKKKLKHKHYNNDDHDHHDEQHHQHNNDTNTTLSHEDSSSLLNDFNNMLMNINSPSPTDMVNTKQNDQRKSLCYSDEQLSVSAPSTVSSSRNCGVKQQFHNSEPTLSNIHHKTVVLNFNENENI